MLAVGDDLVIHSRKYILYGPWVLVSLVNTSFRSMNLISRLYAYTNALKLRKVFRTPNSDILAYWTSARAGGSTEAGLKLTPQGGIQGKIG